MIPSPPRHATRFLAWILRKDPAAPAILGDLHEDFVARAQDHGLRSARTWYLREAALLGLSRLVRRPSHSHAGTGFMHEFLHRHGWLRDITYTLRSVRRDPGFAFLMILVVGLGVGATTAVYSVMSPLMLAPLPVDDPASLVWIANTEDGNSLSAVTSRSGNLRDFRERTRSFTGLTGYNAFFDQSSYTLVDDGPPEQLMGAGVAHDFLDVLGVEPAVGRGFTVEEGSWGGPRAVVLTHGFWTRRFAADPAVVGTSVTLSGNSVTIVGVLPDTFDFSSMFTPGVGVDFLLPWPVSDETDRWGNTMSLIGRLAPGRSVEAAQAELDAVIAGLEEEQPDRWGLGARVSPLQAHIAGPFRPALLLLAAAAGAVILLVCVNVSNLLLARSPRRAREVAVRRALGATRGRIVRQLLVETVFLSLAGGVLGTALAVLVTRFIAGTSGIEIPLLDRVSVDAGALVVAFLSALATGIVVGVVPALQVADGGEASTLRASARGASAHRGARRLQETLVVAEVALACVLLLAGGLFLRSFRAVLDVDLGFDPDDAVAWQLNPSPDFESGVAMAEHYSALTARVADVPGVVSVGLIDALPLGKNRTWTSRVADRPDEESAMFELFPHIIDPGYLDAMGIPVLAGRGFSRDDTHETRAVVLINETAAETLFPGESPLGRTLVAGGGGDREIVGVVADVRHVTPELGPGIQVYFAVAQLWDFDTMDLIVRGSLPTETLTQAVAGGLSDIDPAMPTRDSWTLASTVDRSVSPRRFTLEILTAFGAVALLLAALGIYGVLSHSVAERAREISIRMALGASASEVRRSVVGRTFVLAVLGIILGLAVALPGSKLLSSLLYGVTPADPVTLATLSVILLAVAGLSGLVPALRASRTDGLGVLRSE